MRIFSDGVKAQLVQDHISAFFLVTWYLGDRTLRHTTFPYDLVTGLSTRPFYAANGLVSVDAPRISDTVDREVYKLAYLDESLAMLNLLSGSSGGIGTRCVVHIGLLNTSDVVVNGILPGHPMVAKEDLIIAYQGVLDTYGYVLNTDDELISTFDCSSPLAALDVVKPRYTSPDSVPAGDHCYDAIHKASAIATMHWGRIA